MLNQRQILVAGVGNLLLSDDGVGVQALHELQQQPLPGVTMADIGTAVLHGLHFLETANRVLVIDAARGGQPPGTIYCFDANPGHQFEAKLSLHAMGLLEACRVLLPQKKDLPFTVIGVEPATLDYGLELSRPVQLALPRVVALARTTLTQWIMDGTESPAPDLIMNFATATD